MKGIKKIILVTLSVVGLSACGGSSGGSSSSAGGNSAADELKTGIYGGYWTASDGSSGVLAGPLSRGKMYAISSDGTTLYLDMSLNGLSVISTGRVQYDGNNVVKTGTIDGTGTLTGSDIVMTLNRSDGITNTVTLTRHAVSDSPSSFDLMAGSYKTRSQDTDINISAIGAVSGTDNYGCIYSGDIDIIDSNINVYALTLNIAGCFEYTGHYTGFVSRDNSNGSISAIYSNASRILVTDLYK